MTIQLCFQEPCNKALSLLNIWLKRQKGILEKFSSRGSLEPASPNPLLLPRSVDVMDRGDDRSLFFVVIGILVGPLDRLGEYGVALHRPVPLHGQLRGAPRDDPHGFLHSCAKHTERTVGGVLPSPLRGETLHAHLGHLVADFRAYYLAGQGRAVVILHY